LLSNINVTIIEIQYNFERYGRFSENHNLNTKGNNFYFLKTIFSRSAQHDE